MLRSLIFGKGELRRGKTKTADRSKKVRRKTRGVRTRQADAKRVFGEGRGE